MRIRSNTPERERERARESERESERERETNKRTNNQAGRNPHLFIINETHTHTHRTSCG